MALDEKANLSSTFACCEHTTPPTPDPPTVPTRSTIDYRFRYTFPARCLPCDVAHRRALQDLILATHVGLIKDKIEEIETAEYFMKRDRRHYAFCMENFQTYVAECEEELEKLRSKLVEEVDKVWEGFVKSWDGGTRYREVTGKDGGCVMVKETLKVCLTEGPDGERIPQTFYAL